MPHDASTLRKLLRYDPETGKLFWKKRPVSMFPRAQPCKSWNTRWAGREALTGRDTGGYHQGTICGEHWQAHRVAWTIYYGTCPKLIDHINGNPTDNRIGNLREATRSKNNCNMRVRNARINPVGVTFDTRTNRWRATISLKGKFKSLGYYDSMDDALAVRLAAEEELGFDPNHGSQAGGRRT